MQGLWYSFTWWIYGKVSERTYHLSCVVTLNGRLISGMEFHTVRRIIKGVLEFDVRTATATFLERFYKLVKIITFTQHVPVALNAVTLSAMEKKCICKEQQYGILVVDLGPMKMEQYWMDWWKMAIQLKIVQTQSWIIAALFPKHKYGSFICNGIVFNRLIVLVFVTLLWSLDKFCPFNFCCSFLCVREPLVWMVHCTAHLTAWTARFVCFIIFGWFLIKSLVPLDVGNVVQSL